MATLASQHAGVIIQASGVQQIPLVRFGAMAGLARRAVALATLTSDGCAVRVAGSHVDATAGNPVLFGDMAGRAGEVESIDGHVYVQLR